MKLADIYYCFLQILEMSSREQRQTLEKESERFHPTRPSTVKANAIPDKSTINDYTDNNHLAKGGLQLIRGRDVFQNLILGSIVLDDLVRRISQSLVGNSSIA